MTVAQVLEHYTFYKSSMRRQIAACASPSHNPDSIFVLLI